MLILALFGAAHAADDPFAMAPQVHVLPNGLTVILEENHRTDSIALNLAYGVGSRDERPGELGCAHLFEHLMFEGSANVPTNAFDGWLTAAGGWNNAWTSEDVTAYHMAFPSGALDLALFLESDRVAFLETGLTDDNVANQQAVVLQERAEGYAEPNGRDWDAISRLTWPEEHPYHHPVIGTVEDVDGFETPAVIDFWRRHYKPQNAVLALVGNFESAQVLDQVRYWFADVPDAGPPEPRVTELRVTELRVTEPSPLPDPLVGRHGFLEDDVEERTLHMVWRTVPLGHADEAALDLLGQVLNGGRGTRLDDRLYYDSQLATDDSAFQYSMEIGGQFFVSATSPGTKLKKLEKVILDELRRIETEPPTAAELDRALRTLKGHALDRLESNENRAELLVECHRNTGDADCLRAEWARYQAVTSEDLVQVAKRYLGPEARNTLSVVPRGDTGALPGAVAVELP